jgi:hypothetical protein
MQYALQNSACMNSSSASCSFGYFVIPVYLFLWLGLEYTNQCCDIDIREICVVVMKNETCHPGQNEPIVVGVFCEFGLPIARRNSHDGSLKKPYRFH